jgi:hypothetical protein
VWDSSRDGAIGRSAKSLPIYLEKSREIILQTMPLCAKSSPSFVLTPMKKFPHRRLLFLGRSVACASLLLFCVPGLTEAAQRSGPPVNNYGAPVIDAKGHRIKYDRKTPRRNGRDKRRIDKPAN